MDAETTCETTTEKSRDEVIEVRKGPKFGVRHLQLFLIFLNVVVILFGRINASVALVAMTDAATTNPNFPEYNWTEKQKSYILSSFYWGEILTHIPGGYLCKRYGVKLILFIATFGSGASCLLIPWCVSWGGWQAYCAIRILQGLFQGIYVPCIFEHLAKWSPPEERNFLGVLVISGGDFGTVVSTFVPGLISASSLGWPGLFYVTAGLSLAWCGVWLIIGANNPPASRFISHDERNYIETSLQRSEHFHERKIPVPWRAILTSMPFCACFLVNVSRYWTNNTLQFSIPNYMNGLLKMNIKENALFSTLPYIAGWIMAYVFMIVADVVMKNKWTSLTVVRKVINTVSMWAQAAALIGISYLDEGQEALAVSLLVITCGMGAGSTVGSSLNILDLSQNHTNILSAIVYEGTTFFTILSPLITGIIISDKSDRSQWQIVFIIAALVAFLGNLIYIIFGSAERQPFDSENYMHKKSSISDIPEISKTTLEELHKL